MTTTQLIELLKSVEYGASGRPREISLYTKKGVLILGERDSLRIDSTGDGCAGAELSLRINTPSK